MNKAKYDYSAFFKRASIKVGMKSESSWKPTFPLLSKPLPHERLTEHEAKQFEQDFIDCIGCAPEEYVRIRRAIRTVGNALS